MRGIAFIGTYLPRPCGIATFTYDLAEAIAEEAGAEYRDIVVAMNDSPGGYDYPGIVRCEVQQESDLDYFKAANFLNNSDVDVVNLQHEYGIFGGDRGSKVLKFVEKIRKPLVVTCHTVKNQPDPVKKEVLTEIAAKADKLVVMSQIAFEILESVYGATREKIVYTPHGIHDTPFVEPAPYKAKLGLDGRKVLLTFGLLHPSKGIEYMLEALPSIVEKHPSLTYVILGATHPTIMRDEGDGYRRGLERRVDELGLREHVLFENRFVELDELQDYIGACDILVTPYTKLDQITSGVLPYAMGKGRAVVSTPYWHAKDLLTSGRGRIVPDRDAAALALEIIGLLDDPAVLRSVWKEAYAYSRNMTWSAVARTYLCLFDEVCERDSRVLPMVSARPPQVKIRKNSAFRGMDVMTPTQVLSVKKVPASSPPGRPNSSAGRASG
ncbi:MAG: glycosyltransferase [Deltaproteobacteria bacterium]|nr:glycosyltransferase [Deltaproteobacteria bacterium]